MVLVIVVRIMEVSDLPPIGVINCQGNALIEIYMWQINIKL